MGDVDARLHIFTATALGRGRVASPTRPPLPPGKPPVLILQEAEWTPGPVWTRRSKEKSPPLRHPGSNLGRPARSSAPCRLSHLAHNTQFFLYFYLFYCREITFDVLWILEMYNALICTKFEPTILRHITIVPCRLPIQSFVISSFVRFYLIDQIQAYDHCVWHTKFCYKSIYLLLSDRTGFMAKSENYIYFYKFI